MNRAYFSSLAEKDLTGIALHIAKQNVTAALNLIEKIRDTCDVLAKNPLMGERCPEFRSGQFRSFSVGNYVIYFRPVEDGVEIARIVSGFRDIKQI
jgi:toxin ParE1/3/4